jgi:hypothetical protein
MMEMLRWKVTNKMPKNIEVLQKSIQIDNN